jgi:hypothetical protein
LVSKVIRAVDAEHCRHVDPPTRRLPEHTVLSEELNSFVARPMDADLSIPHDPEPIFESYLRSRIQPEQIARDIPEIIVQRPREPVSDTESAPEQGQAQRRWQTDDGEIGFRRVDRAVIVALVTESRLAGGSWLDLRPGRNRETHEEGEYKQ